MKLAIPGQNKSNEIPAERTPNTLLVPTAHRLFPEPFWPVDHLPLFWRLLNFGLVAALLFLYLCFNRPEGVVRSRAEFWLLLSGLIAQAGVVVSCVAGGIPTRWRMGKNLPVSSVINLLLAASLAAASPVGDVQCAVLMLPPVIVMAFRRPLWQVVPVAMLAGILTLVSPGLKFTVYHSVEMAAIFAATVLAVSEVLVAIVVWLFATALRAEAEQLRMTEARLAAEAKLAAVGRLAAGIAHEIRNPVAMISSSLELASKDDSTPEVRIEMSQIARDESVRLTKLTNDFLAYARAKLPEVRPAPVTGIIEYIAGLVKARASEAGVEVTIASWPDLSIDVDELQIHQVMLNLATNAIDATPRDGTVEFGARSIGDDAVELFVANSGDPIPQAIIARLFEPFFTSKPHGTGLGLPIARNIALAHNGEVRLTENRPGRVCFALRLPRADSRSEGSS